MLEAPSPETRVSTARAATAEGTVAEGPGEAVLQTCRTVPYALLDLFLKMPWCMAGKFIGSRE